MMRPAAAARPSWCPHGGSAYFLIDSNLVYQCGQSGLEVGQGTGFEYMVSPWIEYEAYGIKIMNNVIHDVWGAGLSVNGGYSILMAHNSMYKVGSRSHTVEFIWGTRSCDGDTAACQANYNLRGWGRAAGEAIHIPCRDIMFLNNLVVNPNNASAMWAHFSLPSNFDTRGLSYPSSLANTTLTVTTGLTIAGNVFVNFKPTPGDEMGLGLDPCYGTGSRCDAPFVNANNVINRAGLVVSFIDPARLILDAASKAALRAAGWAHAPEASYAFASWDTAPVATPPASLANAVPYDFYGETRVDGSDLPGAVLSGNATTPPPPPPPPPPPTCPASVCPGNAGLPAFNATCKAPPGEECPELTAGGARSCRACSRGFYSPGGTAANPYPSCLVCAPALNKTTAGTCATNAANCSVPICRPGTAQVGASCATCVAGSYCPGGNLTSPAGSVVPCPTGTNSTAGADSIAKCIAPPCKPGYGVVSATPGCSPCLKGSFSPGGNTSMPNPPCLTCPTVSGATTTTYCAPGLAVSVQHCFPVDTPWAAVNTTAALTGITGSGSALSGPSIILPSTAGLYTFCPNATIAAKFVFAGTGTAGATGVAAALKAAVIIPGASPVGLIELGTLLAQVPASTANTFNPKPGTTYTMYTNGFVFNFASGGATFTVQGNSAQLGSTGIATDVTALNQRAWTVKVKRSVAGSVASYLTSSGQWLGEVAATTSSPGSVAKVLYNNFLQATSIPLILPAAGPLTGLASTVPK